VRIPRGVAHHARVHEEHAAQDLLEQREAVLRRAAEQEVAAERIAVVVEGGDDGAPLTGQALREEWYRTYSIKTLSEKLTTQGQHCFDFYKS
jgi:hypothetical protein